MLLSLVEMLAEQDEEADNECMRGRAILSSILLPFNSSLGARRTTQSDPRCHAWNKRRFVL